MTYRVLADVVVVIHFSFVVFVVIGGILAWWWPRVLLAHAPSVAWGVAIVIIGFTCPLTPLERELRARGGQERYTETFIERYIEGVVYPGDRLREAQAVAAVIVAVGWIGFVVRRSRRRSALASHVPQADGDPA